MLERARLHVAALGGEAHPQHVLVGRDLGDGDGVAVQRQLILILTAFAVGLLGLLGAQLF